MSCRQNRGPTSTRLVSTSFLFLVSTTWEPQKQVQAESSYQLLLHTLNRQRLYGYQGRIHGTQGTTRNKNGWIKLFQTDLVVSEPDAIVGYRQADDVVKKGLALRVIVRGAKGLRSRQGSAVSDSSKYHLPASLAQDVLALVGSMMNQRERQSIRKLFETRLDPLSYDTLHIHVEKALSRLAYVGPNQNYCRTTQSAASP